MHDVDVDDDDEERAGAYFFCSDTAMVIPTGSAASKLFIRGVWLHLGHRNVVRQRLDCFTSLGCHLIHVQPRGALSKIGQKDACLTFILLLRFCFPELIIFHACKKSAVSRTSLSTASLLRGQATKRQCRAQACPLHAEC